MTVNYVPVTAGVSANSGLFLSDRGLPVTNADADTDLSITVKNGVATLAGTAPRAADANMAEYLVSRMAGVKQVINLISHNQESA
jgi:hypothetical protein